MTLNDHWGFHRSDHNWKSPNEVVKMLMLCAIGQGNLLLNVGPDGTGAVPEESCRIIRKVGKWIQDGGDELLLPGIEKLPFAPGLREAGDRGDWDPAGPFYARGNTLYQLMFFQPGNRHPRAGLGAHGSFGSLDSGRHQTGVCIFLRHITDVSLGSQ